MIQSSENAFGLMHDPKKDWKIYSKSYVCKAIALGEPFSLAKIFEKKNSKFHNQN